MHRRRISTALQLELFFLVLEGETFSPPVVEAAGEEVYFLTYCPIFLLFQTYPATFNLSLLSLSATQFLSYTRILNFM
jgi:hypothetical protein